MTSATAILHTPDGGASTPMPEPLAPVHQQPDAPRVGLVALEKLGAALLIDGAQAEDLYAWLVDVATALAGSEANEARHRLLARSIASARAQVAILEGMVAERLAERDPAGLALVDRALTNASRRLVSLLGEHRRTHAPERPVVVAVGHADVTVCGSR